MGVMLREGCSMTEKFCDGTFWSEASWPPAGCVGKPLPGVEIKLTVDEEVFFRSSGLMTGYYKNPEKTSEVLIDGWYHRGDTGKLDENGNLWITGRMSEVFKTTKGKFIGPIKLEDKFDAVLELGQVCICGYGLDQPVMLATRSEFAADLDNQELATKLSETLEHINTKLPPYERIAAIIITPEEWAIMNGLLTPTMKLKRKSLIAKYSEVINAKITDRVSFA